LFNYFRHFFISNISNYNNKTSGQGKQFLGASAAKRAWFLLLAEERGENISHFSSPGKMAAPKNCLPSELLN
jgi:hypothetical protein